jgi:hypothetical protein
MTLYEFLELQNYPVRDAVQYKQAFEAFLNSTQMSPFFDAIMRNASSSAIVELKKRVPEKIKQVWVAFEEFFPPEKRREIENWSHIWDELTLGAGFSTFNLSDSVLRQGFFFSAHEQLLDIQCEIRRVGQIALEKEHNTALKALARGHKTFYSFDEYVNEAWQNTSSHQATLYQRLGYLAYLENLTEHFNQPSQLYSENKNQAQLMHNEMQKWRNIVQMKIKKLESLSVDLVVNKKNHARKSQELSRLRPQKVLSRLDRFINREPSLPIQVSDSELRLKSEIDKLTIEEAHIKAEIQTHTTYLDGVSNEISVNMKKYQDYWQNNLLRFFGRAKDINEMFIASRSTSGGSEDILFRNITKGEYDHLVDIRQFSQVARVCLEREKWFYMKGGNPGANVSHPILCKIYLCTGALDALARLAKPDGQFAAIVTKIAEPNCYGIHEDALPALNAMIKKVEFYQSNTKINQVELNRESGRHDRLPTSNNELSMLESLPTSPRYF